MIFINRDKLKSTESKVCDENNQFHETNRSLTNEPRRPKVYINPNFKNIPTHNKNVVTRVPQSQHVLPVHPEARYSNLTQISTTELSETTKKSTKIQCQHQVDKNHHQDNKIKTRCLALTKKSDPRKSANLSMMSNCKIFLNPGFQGSRKSIVQKPLNCESSKILMTKSVNDILNVHKNSNQEFPNLPSSSINSLQSSFVPKTRLNPTKFTYEKEKDQFKEKQITSSKQSKIVQKVFINPKFNSRQPDRSNLVIIPTKAVDNLPQVLENDVLRPEINHLTPKNGQTYEHSLKRKNMISNSSNNKQLIRKRKISASFLEIKNRSESNKLLFLSKTKLVRNSSKNILNSKKSREKLSIQKLYVKAAPMTAQISPSSAAQTMFIKSKPSVSNSSNSALANSKGKSPFIKIKSKNGKSLKIIRNNQLFHSSSSEMLQQKKVLKRKDLLSQHFVNNSLCYQRKSPFSTVNISLSSNRGQDQRNKYVYKKKSLVVKKSKYNLILNHKNRPKTSLPANLIDKTQFIKSKYRLIRKNSSVNSTCRKSLRNSSPLKFSHNSKKWKNIKNKDSYFKRKQLRIVNIDGTFYTSSRNSLTKNRQKRVPLSGKTTVLQISGKRFKLANNGHTLKCLDKEPGRKRIDIGGITFISSSSGKSLTRTNYHTARSVILQARQKRISLLTRKLRKNNEQCPFFHRFGKCSGKDEKTCTRQHDPRYVRVCKKFVQGCCEDTNCRLNHETSSHNLPTCQHFLIGQCGRDNCPYPHVKVSDAMPICTEFLKGFCLHGDKCSKRHFNICPSFEKGCCSRGKYCPYPHPKSKTLTHRAKRPCAERKAPAKSPETVSNSNLRYFEDSSLQIKNESKCEDGSETVEDEESSDKEERIHPKRPKLGRLPSFIPLTFDGSFNTPEET